MFALFSLEDRSNDMYLDPCGGKNSSYIYGKVAVALVFKNQIGKDPR